MPGCHLKSIVCALALVLLTPAFAATDPPPCSTQGDMKSTAWRSSCDAAIANEPDTRLRATLLFGRAYGAVEDYRYDDAVADLTAALVDAPDTVAYLRERAYVHVELSNFELAIADLDRAITLDPKEVLAYRERAYARHFNADLRGAYEDRAREFELTPDAAGALLARGDAALWLGRFDDARADVKRARKFAKASGDKDALAGVEQSESNIEQWRNATRNGNANKLCNDERLTDKELSRKLIGDCTNAFLGATTGVTRADALTTRSSAWLVVTGSQKNSTEDLSLARAFDPENVRRHINLGYSYLLSNHSWAANREFERAVAMVRDPFALAGRAAARLNLGNKEGAKVDALASNELEPNEGATGVLANLAYERGDRDEARELYLLIYERGSRADDLIERLHELGVPDPDAAIKK
jgi:tetratricopeptide (TPR) repeat protein